MPAEPPDPEGHPVAANDNGDAAPTGLQALAKGNDVVLQLARLIGRRMAREDFAARIAAANDNEPPSDLSGEGSEEPGVDGDE